MGKREDYMILAVDLGNYNIKTSEGIHFSSRFTEDNTGAAPSGEEILEYNNRTYLMGKGNFDHTFNKAKKDYIPNLLTAIAKSVPSKVKEIKLVLGVPLDNLGLRETFSEELEGKKFEFVFNGDKREIIITKLATIGEGISSYYTLSDKERVHDTMIVDIGGRTVNVVTYKNKKQDNRYTIPKGMIDVYDEIKTKENNVNGENYTLDIIEEYISKGIIKDHKDIKIKFIKHIMNEIKLKSDVRAFRVCFTGGGAIRLKDVIDITKTFGVNDFKVIDDALFSNVEGNKKIAELKWSE